VAYEVFDGTNMVRQLFGETPSVTDEAGDTLPQRVIEALDMVGCPGVLRDGCVLRYWNNPRVDGILIGIECRLLTGDCRNIGPQLFRTVGAAGSHRERNDWPCLLVHRDPDPLFTRLLLHEAPHLVHFDLKTPYEHIPGRGHGPHIQMVRQRRKTGNHKIHEPSDTDADRTANAMEGDFLTE